MNRLYFLIGLMLLSVMVYAQSDGSYCADVGRYNPKTGKESSYRLTVGVENNHLIRLDWPNGHSSDSNEFNPAFIQKNKAVFRTYEGVNFVVTILKKGEDCFEDVPKARQCDSNTKTGRRCKNMTDNPSQKCYVHNK